MCTCNFNFFSILQFALYLHYTCKVDATEPHEWINYTSVNHKHIKALRTWITVPPFDFFFISNAGISFFKKMALKDENVE